MRNCQRNYRTIWFANPTGETESVKDEYGNDTLEVKTIYDTPKKMKCNIGSSGGQDVVEIFGSTTEYQRIISFSGSDICPLKEGCRVWFGVDATSAHNYRVVKVADSKNCSIVALREVSQR